MTTLALTDQQAALTAVLRATITTDRYSVSRAFKHGLTVQDLFVGSDAAK